MRFTKMHGSCNDYVFVDCLEQDAPSDPARLAQAVSERHTGIGADGLILICPSATADVGMRMWNADGSEGEMCGNGIRCLAKYVYDRAIIRKEQIKVETQNGVLELELQIADCKVDRVRVNMGRPIFEQSEIPTKLRGSPPIKMSLSVAPRVVEVTCLSLGNPHCVLFVDEIDDDWVLGVGPQLEKHPVFPNRTNVEFVQVVSPGEIVMRVWERGSGETQACGTGASAAIVAGVLNKLTERDVVCHLPGGDLKLEYPESGEVFLTGPAMEVFSGDWPDE